MHLWRCLSEAFDKLKGECRSTPTFWLREKVGKESEENQRKAKRGKEILFTYIVFCHHSGLILVPNAWPYDFGYLPPCFPRPLWWLGAPVLLASMSTAHTALACIWLTLLLCWCGRAWRRTQRCGQGWRSWLSKHWWCQGCRALRSWHGWHWGARGCRSLRNQHGGVGCGRRSQHGGWP